MKGKMLITIDKPKKGFTTFRVLGKLEVVMAGDYLMALGPANQPKLTLVDRAWFGCSVDFCLDDGYYIRPIPDKTATPKGAGK